MSRKRVLAGGVAAIAAVAAAFAVEVTSSPAARPAATPAASPAASSAAKGARVQTAKVTMAEAKTAATAADPTISQISGNGGVITFSGQASGVALNQLQGLATDAAGDIFVANTYDNQVGEISAPSTWTPEPSDPSVLTGAATLIAGKDEWVTSYSPSGQLLDLGNGGPAASATLNTPSAVAADAKGDVFIADTENNMVREVTPNGIIKTVAGTGQPGYSGDGGPAVRARLDNPSGLAVSTQGDLFIADTVNNVIREITASGIIKTVAGEPGKFGDAGDGGQAARAELNAPADVAVDAAGNLYIADTGSNALREVSAAGVISTLAGGNGEGNSGQGGAASAAQLDTPESVAVDSSTGDVYVTSRSGVLDQITGLSATS